MSFPSDSDISSTFSYQGDIEPHTSNITVPTNVANEWFGKPCKLQKVPKGDFHKIEYSLSSEVGKSLTLVGLRCYRLSEYHVRLRVASPGFPKDKVE